MWEVWCRLFREDECEVGVKVDGVFVWSGG